MPKKFEPYEAVKKFLTPVGKARQHAGQKKGAAAVSPGMKKRYQRAMESFGYKKGIHKSAYKARAKARAKKR